jgi:hypothetical protein
MAVAALRPAMVERLLHTRWWQVHEAIFTAITFCRKLNKEQLVSLKLHQIQKII